MKTKKINAADLKKSLQTLPNSSLLIIDVRQSEEYYLEHIDNTINLPLVDLASKPKDFWVYKIIIIIAKTKDEGLKACKILETVPQQELYYTYDSMKNFSEAKIRIIKT